jgi:hypothetical protein
MLCMARIVLDAGEKDVGCDHKGEQPVEQRQENSSSTPQAATEHAACQRTQQPPQPPVVDASAAPSTCSSSAYERSSAGDPGWPALLAAVRAGSPGALVIADLTARLQQL